LKKIFNRRTIIADSCVLIDIYKQEPSLLSEISQNIGSILIPLPLFDEVIQLTEEICESLGLTIYEPEIEHLLAAAKRIGGLSFGDRLCLLICAEKHCTLYTNDKSLRNAALSRDIDVRWGLELFHALVTQRIIDRKKAIQFATNICNAFPFPPSRRERILREFISKCR
jgi:hypothetical protein